MAMTSFTVEGEVQLGYLADEESCCDRMVHLKEDDSEDMIRIEQLIAKNLNFPNLEEFDVHIQRMEALRQEGLQPLDDHEPDIVREGVRLRISVEVVE